MFPTREREIEGNISEQLVCQAFIDGQIYLRGSGNFNSNPMYIAIGYSLDFENFCQKIRHVCSNKEQLRNQDGDLVQGSLLKLQA